MKEKKTCGNCEYFVPETEVCGANPPPFPVFIGRDADGWPEYDEDPPWPETHANYSRCRFWSQREVLDLE